VTIEQILVSVPSFCFSRVAKDGSKDVGFTHRSGVIFARFPRPKINLQFVSGFDLHASKGKWLIFPKRTDKSMYRPVLSRIAMFGLKVLKDPLGIQSSL
jgi:hypothetical protein